MNCLTSLVLQRIQSLSSLCYLCDVLPHDTHSVVDLLLNGCCFRVAGGSTWVGRGAIARKVGVVRFGPRVCAASIDATRHEQQNEHGSSVNKTRCLCHYRCQLLVCGCKASLLTECSEMKSPAVLVDNESRVCGGAVSLVTRDVSPQCPLFY